MHGILLHFAHILYYIHITTHTLANTAINILTCLNHYIHSANRYD